MAVVATTAAPQVTIRQGGVDDSLACGRIFYDAFAAIAARHDFPCEPPSPDFTAWRASQMLAHPGFHGVVAVRDGRVVGSAFMDERSAIRGVGPVTVEPAAQDAGIGRVLMGELLRRAEQQGAPGVRLVQTAYHYRSLALYARLGFATREPLSVMQGAPIGREVAGRPVRRATIADIAECDRLCHRVHGHGRAQEVADAINDHSAMLVEHEGRISGYATGFGYASHAVGEGNDDLRALLGAAEGFLGLGVLVPTRNSDLLTWCLDHGLRIVQQSTLMTTGLYNEPAGGYLPSILF